MSLGSPRKRALTPTMLSRAKTPVGAGSSVAPSAASPLQIPDEVRMLPVEELQVQCPPRHHRDHHYRLSVLCAV